MTIRWIERRNGCYPANLAERMAESSPAAIASVGNLDILGRRRLGLNCSIQCPGSIVIKTYDAIRKLRDAGVVVAGGFHSPMERECLHFLLKGTQPVIVCPAKGLARLRLPESWWGALAAGRLIFLSMFTESVKHTTADQAAARNGFITARQVLSRKSTMRQGS